MKRKIFNQRMLLSVCLIIMCFCSISAGGQTTIAEWPIVKDLEPVVTGDVNASQLTYNPSKPTVTDRAIIYNPLSPELDLDTYYQVAVSPVAGTTFQVKKIKLYIYVMIVYIQFDIIASFSPDFETYEVLHTYYYYKNTEYFYSKSTNIKIPEGDTLYIRICPYRGTPSGERVELDKMLVEGVSTPYTPPVSLEYDNESFCPGGGIAEADFTGPSGGTFSSEPGLALDPVTGNIDVDNSTPGTYLVSYTLSGDVVTTAEITVSTNPECLITGPEEPFCPRSTYTFSAPPGMHSYAWTVTGNASVAGIADAPEIEVETGDTCEGFFTVSVAVTNENGCTAECSREFAVGEPQPLTYMFPENTTTQSCQSQETINDLFNTWLSQVSFEGGCNTRISHVPGLDELVPPDACGGDISVTWTLTSDCGSAVEKTASFNVPRVTPVSLTVPENVYIQTTCLPQAEIDQAFNSWLTEASAEGGCNTELIVSPSAEELTSPDACGGSITVTWTARSDCEEDFVKSATFYVAGPTPPVSEYAFLYEVPDGVCCNSPVFMPVKFQSVLAGYSGYDAVRLKIEASGPADATLTTTGMDGTIQSFTNTGYWGPDEGFSIPSEYNQVTSWEMNFTEPGSYTLSFSLVDASTDEVINNLTKSAIISAGEVPDPPGFDLQKNTHPCDGTVRTAVVEFGDQEEVVWYTSEAGNEVCNAPSASSAGTYTAWAESRNLMSGCTSLARTEVKLLMLEPVSAVMSGTQMICSDEDARITVSLTGQAPWSFQWTDGINVFQETEVYEPEYTLAVNPDATTTYNLTGLVTDGSEAIGTATGEAVVYVGPVTTVPNFLACTHSIVRIPVTVKAFKKVSEISLSLRYDSGVLDYSGWEQGEIQSGSGEIKVNDVAVNGDLHILRISGIAETGSFPDLPDDAVLLWLEWEYSEGTTALEWIDSPDDSWCSYSFRNSQDETGFETEVYCDLPSNSYYLDGSVSAYPVPEAQFLLNGIIAGSGDSFTYCSNENVSITLQDLNGTAPFNVRWTVNGEEEMSALIGDGDALYDGTFSAGSYELQLTSLTDANGCELADVTSYRTSWVVNEEPDIFFTLNGDELLPFDVVTFCADVSEIPLSLVENQGDQHAKGLAPFQIEFTLSNGGTGGTLDDVDYNSVTDLTECLPKDQYGLLVAGEYIAEITSLTDANGCQLSPGALAYYTFTLVIEPQPDLFLAINEVPFLPGSVASFCSDEQSIRLTLQESQGEIRGSGKAPFSLHFTVNGGEEIILADVGYDTEIDLLNSLPANDFTGGTAAGDYHLIVTHFSDADGCSLTDGVISEHTYTVRINPEPVVSVIPENAYCFGTETGSVIMDPADPTLNYRYTLDPGGYDSGERTGGFAFTGLSAGTYTWTTTDLFTSCSTSGTVTVGEPGVISLTGIIRYYNASGTPLENVAVNLLEPQTGSIVATTASKSDGTYSFDQVCPGVYLMELSSEMPVYSINSTDAGQANAWNIAQAADLWPAIEKVRFLAGDVNGDDYVNAGDASMIQHHFLTLGMDVEFDKDWEFWRTDETINVQPQSDNLLLLEIPTGSTGEVHDFYGLVSGDFNRSYMPQVNPEGNLYNKSVHIYGEPVTLLKGDLLNVDAGDVVELPVRALSALQLRAISLLIDHSTENVEILDVFLEDDPNQPVAFNIVNNMLVIGWNSVNAISVDAGNAVLTVRIKAVAESAGLPYFFNLSASNLNELADENLTTIEDASLIMDGLQIKGMVTDTNLPESPQMLALECYPNPFDDNLTLHYSLPEQGYVNLTVTGILGNRVTVTEDLYKLQGEHRVLYNTRNLAPGVYQVALKFTNQSGETFTKTSRIIKK